MRPAHLLLAVAGAATFGLGGAGLAAGITWLRIDHVERQLEAEFAELGSRGLLVQPSTAEGDEQRAARETLADLLVAVAPDGSTYPLFGTPGMLQEASPEELRLGLERRAGWYAAVEALPAVLWSAAGEPRAPEGGERPQGYVRRPSDSMGALREATNHLCAMAWHVGQDPRRTAEAGRWLARGIALARATDSGSHMDLQLRVMMEQIVLERAERLSAIEGVDRDVLLRDVREELARWDERDRLARALESDLRWLEWQFQSVRTRGIGTERLVLQRDALAQVRAWRALLADDPQGRLPELAARLEDRSLPDSRRLDHVLFASWQQRGERVAAVLAGS